MLNNCRSHILEQYHKNDTVAYRCSYGDKNYDVVSLEKAKIYHDEHLSEDTLSLPV